MTIRDEGRAMDAPVGAGPVDWSRGHAADPLADRRGSQLGAPLSRVDGGLKVRGAAPFAAEYDLEGMVYAAVAFSTVAKGRIVHLDTAAAESAPGVVLVMTYRNAPRLNPPSVFLTKPKGAAGDDVPVLQDEQISWNGQPVALVLAETQEQADHAVTLVDVRFEADPAATGFDEAKRDSREPAPSLGPMTFAAGDADTALAGAAASVDVVYTTPRHNHNAIEPHAVTVAWTGDHLRVHDSTQAVDFSGWTLADMFGVPEDNVHVTAPFLGGGFGGKTLWQHQVLAAAASRLAGRPVRLSLTREGVYRLVGGRARTEQRVALGADAEGHLQALIHQGVASTTPHAMMPEPFINPAHCLYQSQSMKLEVRVAPMDAIANTFMRAPGESVGTFALESAMDELADRLDLDPIELRLRNEPTQEPVSGLLFSSRNLDVAYRLGAERFGWADRASRPASRRDGDWWVGAGVATATYPYARMPGGAARIRLRRGGYVVVEVAAHEMGMGTATVQAQITAERLAVPVERVTVAIGDSLLPGIVLAGGSQQTAAIGASVIAAHRVLLQQLVGLAPEGSPVSGAGPDELAAYDAGICRLDDPTAWLSYDAILEHAGRDELVAQADAPDPKEAQTWSMHSFGAVFSEVRVDAVTGETRVSRLLGSFDTGRIINAKTAASQFRGGMIMGIGLALTEVTELDERTGRIMNPSLAEYHVPSHLDVPEIDVIWTDIADPHSPMGARGVGEIGITGVAASIANAVYNATGVRVRDLPITLDKTLPLTTPG